MILNSYTFTIGNGVGEYPAGASLTDSIISLGTIAGIGHGNQTYYSGFNATGNCLEFGNIFTTVNMDKVTVIFQHPLTINNNA